MVFVVRYANSNFCFAKTSQTPKTIGKMTLRSNTFGVRILPIGAAGFARKIGFVTQSVTSPILRVGEFASLRLTCPPVQAFGLPVRASSPTRRPERCTEIARFARYFRTSGAGAYAP